MANPSTINTVVTPETLPAIAHNGKPVVTTALLAKLYGTDDIRIQQNYLRNAGRFEAGKHYHKLEGAELKAFKHRLSLSYPVEKQARSVMLWTERGAARHAKMLDTDAAWDVFEKLEDCYFGQAANVALPAPVEQELLTLDYDGRRLRILQLDGAPWLVASDVALALGLRNSYVIVRRLTAGQHQKHAVGAQQVNILKMSAVRQAMLMAAPERASKFGKWLEQALEFQQAPVSQGVESNRYALPKVAESTEATQALREIMRNMRFQVWFDFEGRLSIREVPEGDITIPRARLATYIGDPEGAPRATLPDILEAVSRRMKLHQPNSPR